MILQIVSFALLLGERRCKGSGIDKGVIATLKGCADKCASVSSMFIYGSHGTNGCYSNGCSCWCQPSASADGTCETKEHSLYHLYSIVQGDYYLFDIFAAIIKDGNVFCYLIKVPFETSMLTV